MLHQACKKTQIFRVVLKLSLACRQPQKHPKHNKSIHYEFYEGG